MCGIVGSVGYDRKVLRTMNNSQIHRGPDESGEYWDEACRVGLAMRRLSIVDITGGSQPMFNENHDISIVFNGEIFNSDELRKKLLNNGHIFTTHNSDTEVIVHLYEEVGSRIFSMLNGMFAILIYDSKKQIILGARDYAGMKPLYYHHSEKGILFASELKSIWSTNETSKEIDGRALADYLSFQQIPSPLTIYKDVKKIVAGQAFIYEINDNTIELFRYFDLKDSLIDEITDFRNASISVRNGLENAVKRWSMSDVPISCLLSGGIDSASVTALLARNSNVPIKTFSLGFADNEDIDERKMARLVADKYGTDHTEIVITPKDLLQELDEMVYSLDEPYSGGIPSWYLYKQIGESYKVAFTGVGGDELFGNYQKWKRYENVKERVFRTKNEFQKGASILDILKNPNGSIYHKYFPERMKRKLLLRYDDSYSVDSYYQNELNKYNKVSFRDRIPLIDFRIQLSDEFCFMTDRFSMAYSVEARTPFLDKLFIQDVMAISSSIRTSEASPKGLLIDAVKDLLPSEIIGLPKKGFVIPYQNWLTNDLRKEVEYYFSKDYIDQQGLFKYDQLHSIFASFCLGKREYTPFIWTVFMFQKWYERYVIM